MNRGYSGGKRQREAERDRKKKEKEARLQHNRELRSQGIEPGGGQSFDIEPTSAQQPEVKLEDVVISVPRAPRRSVAGPTKLFVGGLSWDTTTDDLRVAFSKFGTIVDVAVIPDRATGRSRGFGFVTFETPEAADNAVKGMHGTELDGRTLKVNRAEAR